MRARGLRNARRGIGVVLALAVAMASGALSRVPYSLESAERAAVRLSWRSPSTRVEVCRRLSPEELAGRPRHMRQPEVCEGRLLPYRLSVLLDGEEVLRESVEPAGARRDRPLYVFRELSLRPGRHRLAVRFAPGEVPASGAGSDGEAPPTLTLDTLLTLPPSGVALVTYSEATRRLVVRR